MEQSRFKIPEADTRFTETLTLDQQVHWWKSKYIDAMSTIQMILESEIGKVLVTTPE